MGTRIQWCVYIPSRPMVFLAWRRSAMVCIYTSRRPSISMVCLCSINPLTRVGGSRVEFELDRGRPVMKYGEKILRTFRTKGETRPADGAKETLVRCISSTQACEYLHATCVWIHEDTKAVHVDGMECMFSTSLDWHPERCSIGRGVRRSATLLSFPFPSSILRPL